MQYKKTLVMSGLLLSLGLANTQAAILYSYQSAPYTYINNAIDPTIFPAPVLSDHATFSFILDQPLANNLTPANVSVNNIIPLSWSISDGSYSDNSILNPGALKTLTIQTDSSGKIADFFVNYNFPSATKVSGYIEVYSTDATSPLYQNISGNGALINASFETQFNFKQDLANTQQIGAWSITTVPLPNSIWLFMSAVFGIMTLKRRAHI